MDHGNSIKHLKSGKNIIFNNKVNYSSMTNTTGGHYICVCVRVCKCFWPYMLLLFCLLINNNYISIISECENTHNAIHNLHKVNDHVPPLNSISGQLICMDQIVADDDTNGKVAIILFTFLFN